MSGVSGYRRGDIVLAVPRMGGVTMAGMVKRAARDGSWVDVRWGSWSKRQRYLGLLVLATGYTIRDALAWTGRLADALWGLTYNDEAKGD